MPASLGELVGKTDKRMGRVSLMNCYDMIPWTILD